MRLLVLIIWFNQDQSLKDHLWEIFIILGELWETILYKNHNVQYLIKYAFILNPRSRCCHQVIPAMLVVMNQAGAHVQVTLYGTYFWGKIMKSVRNILDNWFPDKLFPLRQKTAV